MLICLLMLASQLSWKFWRMADMMVSSLWKWVEFGESTVTVERTMNSKLAQNAEYECNEPSLMSTKELCFSASWLLSFIEPTTFALGTISLSFLGFLFFILLLLWASYFSPLEIAWESQFLWHRQVWKVWRGLFHLEYFFICNIFKHFIHFIHLKKDTDASNLQLWLR